MPKRSSKRPRDVNMLAFATLAESSGQGIPGESTKNPAAVLLGRLGGLRGGPARARKLTKRQRSDIAKKAAKVRWQAREK